jgi:hypothetical protein
LHLWAIFRRRNVVMGIDVWWVSRGRRDVVSYHKGMTSHNFFDFGVTCSTLISLWYYQISFQPKEGAFYIWKLFWSLWIKVITKLPNSEQSYNYFAKIMEILRCWINVHETTIRQNSKIQSLIYIHNAQQPCQYKFHIGSYINNANSLRKSSKWLWFLDINEVSYFAVLSDRCPVDIY